MRTAMAYARIGDDVYGEDPTVNELEELAAEKVGKEAGVFVASGTMGNLAGILAHATRGEGVIVGLDTHAFRAEAGGLSAVAGLVPQPLETDEYGRMDLVEVEEAISPDDPHYPRTKLILVENSYGDRNGYPIEEQYFADIHSLAKRRNLSVHLDGARLFNAAAALNLSPKKIARHVDSVTFCLSKGLCAPVGSVICGTAAFATEARRARKILGGGMRQAGIVAAAGIIALDEMVDRLPEDHANAKRLAEGIRNINGLVIDPPDVKTNIVFFHLDHSIRASAQDIASELFTSEGIRIGVTGKRTFRSVTHYWIGSSEVDLLLSGLARIVARRGL
jgi:threonine aldolase